MDENKISFLWKASQSLPPNQQITKLLKSYYLSNLKTVAGKLLSTSTKSGFSDKAICHRCSTRWCDGDYVLSHKSAAVSSPRAGKLVDALNKGEKLSKRQKLRAKWYRKRLNSAVVVTCNLCHHKTPLHLQKPDEEPKKPKISIQEVQTKTKSKKKKNDKNAGLKIPINKLKNIKQQKPPKQPIVKKEKKILPSSVNIKKTKTTLQPPKVISHTKQKNTLLQLATMLKANSKSNSGNDRLKNLLK